MNKTAKAILAAAAIAALAIPLRADTEVVDGITWTYSVCDGKASVCPVDNLSTGNASLMTVPVL